MGIYEFFDRKIQESGERWEYRAELADAAHQLNQRSTAFGHVWAERAIGEQIDVYAMELLNRRTVLKPETFGERHAQTFIIQILATVSPGDIFSRADLSERETYRDPNIHHSEPVAAKIFLQRAIETQLAIEAEMGSPDL